MGLFMSFYQESCQTDVDCSWFIESYKGFEILSPYTLDTVDKPMIETKNSVQIMIRKQHTIWEVFNFNNYA